MRAPALTLLLLPPLAAAAPLAPRPGELRTFGDWTVGCDNTRVCTLASLGTDGGDFPPSTLALTRQPGPAGGWELAIERGEDTPPPPPTAAAVDGRRIGLPALAGAPVAALVAAMKDGRVLVLGGRGNAPVSLRGAAAALRWIDERQGRVGTVTATVARGSAPATKVPARPPLPVVTALAASGAGRRPDPRQLAQMRRIGACEDRLTGWEVRTGALGGGATLVLLPCSAGAYNQIDALFVLRGDRVEPARTDAPSGFAETGADSGTPVASVVNADIRDGILTSYAKGRGLGDCGVSQAFAWDGRRLRLTDQAAMGECRGNPHFITTWRTRLVRRRP